MMRLHQDVSMYAAQLESSIHLSSTDYRFESMHHMPKCLYEPVTVKFLNDIISVDVETRMTLKPDSPVVADCDGLIGIPLLLVEPFLKRQDKLERKEIMLRKTTFLVKLFSPLAMRAK